nr:hypothetical protein [Tanacetum cinerariifolium]
MNHDCYNSNSSGFDQSQPPQFPVVHPPPQETSIEISHDQENVINSVQTFLRKFNRYSFFETPKVLLLAWDRVSEIKDAFENKQYKPEDIQELFRKLLDDLKNIHGNTTTQSDISLPEYDLFIFDLSNDQFPPTDSSDFTHEEFGDEPAPIISPPEYECFYCGNFPDSGELISSLNSGIRENLSSTTCVNLPAEDDHSPLLAYVVWIFLAYLTYPVIPPHLHSFGNKDTIF